MKKINQIFIAILTPLLLLPAITTVGQPVPASEINLETGLTVKSTFNGKYYQLRVSLPASYSATDTNHYPVLYVLDGKYSFGSFHSIRQILDIGKEIEEVIIVAIGDDSKTYQEWLANRHSDFTTSHSAQNDIFFEKMFNLDTGALKSGGADLFLKTLKNDIMPAIEKNYRTNGDNGISGHSLGGLFAGYCLLVEPLLFNRYGINSPSFWWNQQQFKSLESNFVKTSLNSKINIFLSAGNLEGEMMITPMIAFKDGLSALNSSNLMLHLRIFEDETHLSVVPACSSRTLKVLYGKNLDR